MILNKINDNSLILPDRQSIVKFPRLPQKGLR